MGSDENFRRGYEEERGRQAYREEISLRDAIADNNYWRDYYRDIEKQEDGRKEAQRRAALSPTERAVEDLRHAHAVQDTYWRAYHDHWRNPRFTRDRSRSFTAALWWAWYSVVPAIALMFLALEQSGVQESVTLIFAIPATVFAISYAIESRRTKRRVDAGRYGTLYDRSAFNPDRPESSTNVRPPHAEA